MFLLYRTIKLSILSVVSALWLAKPVLAQQVWFGPRSEQPHFQAAPDWEQLFQPGAPWKSVAMSIQAFKFDEGFFQGQPNTIIAPVVANLNQRHVAIAMVIQSLAYTSAQDCGHGSEGYHFPAEGRVAAENLKRAGGDLRYLLMDGPLWFGHYEKKPGACHASVDDVVRRVALNVGAVLKVFPNAEVTDIEGTPLGLMPDWKAEYAAFKRQLEAALDHPIAAIAYDVNWEDPRWPEAMKEMTDFARSSGMKVSITYNGDGKDHSDQEWIDHAIRNFTEVQTVLHIIPDRAIFSSWNNYPSHLLPETDDRSMTWLVKRFIQFRDHSH